MDVLDASVLDKTQVSFKQAVSPSSARGDALFLLAPTQANDVEAAVEEEPSNVINFVFARAHAQEHAISVAPTASTLDTSGDVTTSGCPSEFGDWRVLPACG